MSKQLTTFSLVMILASGQFIFSVEKDKEKINNIQVQSPRKEGFQLSVIVPTNNPAGLPISIKMKFENSGNKMGKWGSFDVNIELKDQNGKPVPLTCYGKKNIEPQSAGSYRRSGIHPGGTQEYSINNICLFFDLTIPQDYFLTVTNTISIYEMGKIKFQDLDTKDKKAVKAFFQQFKEIGEVTLKAGPVRFTVGYPP